MTDWTVDEAIALTRKEEKDNIARLREFVRIESVSMTPARADDVMRASEWLAHELRRIGFEHVRIHETEGHPIVTADWLNAGSDVPTVLIYGHVDVQPVEPVSEWTVPPFDITERDDRLYGRGSTDDKGQLLMHLVALDALMRNGGGRLPCNFKLVVDAEEEIGSPSLLGWMKSNPELVTADFAVVSDSPMYDYNMPSIACSLRGIANLEVELRSADGDVHAGQFGGAIANAARSLSRILAALHDADGCVTVPGFYDGVPSIAREERERFACLPFDENAWMASVGALGAEGEAGFSTLERTWVRPTLEINGLFSGHIAEGTKAIVPAVATAKLSCRLVAGQDPEALQNKVAEHIAALAPANVRCMVKRLSVVPPAAIDHRSAAVQLAASSLAQAFATEVFLVRDGGAIPAVAHLKDHFSMDTLLMGFGCPDENKHGPDEWLAMLHFRKGIEALIAYWPALARTGAQ
ncbi:MULTISPECIES: dipeptidase [unclassified Nitratireductor]|uniref:dipeptidase n=1 Tax=unclassified Nitratireductor TaxID=2641084 RepID=UPI0025FBB2BE|nr:dipeptidase [Nitratireductor sp.]